MATTSSVALRQRTGVPNPLVDFACVPPVTVPAPASTSFMAPSRRLDASVIFGNDDIVASPAPPASPSSTMAQPPTQSALFGAKAPPAAESVGIRSPTELERRDWHWQPQLQPQPQPQSTPTPTHRQVLVPQPPEQTQHLQQQHQQPQPPNSSSHVQALEVAPPAWHSDFADLPGFAVVRDDSHRDVYALYLSALADLSHRPAVSPNEQVVVDRGPAADFHASSPPMQPTPPFAIPASPPTAVATASDPSAAATVTAAAAVSLYPGTQGSHSIRPVATAALPPAAAPSPLSSPPLPQPQQLQLLSPAPQFGQMSSADLAAISSRNFVPKSVKTPARVNKGGGATNRKGAVSKKRASAAEAGDRPSKALKPVILSRPKEIPANSSKASPHAYLISLLESRGYASSIYASRDCGYKSSPTPLQIASYGTVVLRATEARDARGLSALLTSGLSRNPCNRFSESILALSARRGDEGMFSMQLDAGADVQTADDFGRTPLHYAAWSSGSRSFGVVERILQEDPDMARVADDRGRAPFEYVRECDWEAWIAFLEENRDRFWPVGEGEAGRGRAARAGADDVPRPKRGADVIPDPVDALPVEVAQAVASGKINPQDARSVHPQQEAHLQPPPQQGFNFPSMMARVQGKSVHAMFSSGDSAKKTS